MFKNIWFGLSILLVLSFQTMQAHSIPPELLRFLAENPDASDAEIQAFIEVSDFADSAQLWGEDEVVQTFNMPPELVGYLLENPRATEPEILAFTLQSQTLRDTDWPDKIQMLVDGEGFDENPFSLNDLVLLDQIGETFDQVYETQTLNWWQFIKNYTKLGVEHILVGLDHILFVMSLVLLLPPWRHILKMVTAFTVAHSVTLLLGGTNLLTLSSKVVEPIIALSIAYMALTTVFLSKKYPWFAQAHTSLWVVFLFGLFHGLGFAGVFAAVAPDPSRLLPSLLFFNIGVEIGQILILLFFVPFLWALKQLNLSRYFIPVFTILISILALWWVFVRIFMN